MTKANDSPLTTMFATIGARNLLAPGERVVLGVSGGADSVALTYLMRQLAYKPILAHLNHQARGKESDQDEVFVGSLAKTLDLPFESRSCDIAGEAKEKGLSFEAHGRIQRYAFFAEVAKKYGVAKIATAHHADDQVETVLMRILRGTGPEGLKGMKYARAWEGFEIIRPLLDCRHDDLTRWLDENKLAWREDQSNFDLCFLRNRVRHELLPLLRQSYNPQVDGALLNLAETQVQENAYWDGILDACVSERKDALDRVLFRSWPSAQQRRALLRFTQHRNLELTHGRILYLCHFICNAPAGARADLSASWQIYCGTHEALFYLNGCHAPGKALATLPIPGSCKAMGKRFSSIIMDTPPLNLKRYCNGTRQVFDADKIQGPLLVRNKCDGDVFVPLGMTGKKKVSDCLVDKKIPAPLRRNIPMLISGGEIIWIVGVIPSQLAAVCALTKNYLQIEVHDETE